MQCESLKAIPERELHSVTFHGHPRADRLNTMYQVSCLVPAPEDVDVPCTVSDHSAMRCTRLKDGLAQVKTHRARLRRRIPAWRYSTGRHRLSGLVRNIKPEIQGFTNWSGNRCFPVHIRSFAVRDQRAAGGETDPRFVGRDATSRDDRLIANADVAMVDAGTKHRKALAARVSENPQLTGPSVAPGRVLRLQTPCEIAFAGCVYLKDVDQAACPVLDVDGGF